MLHGLAHLVARRNFLPNPCTFPTAEVIPPKPDRYFNDYARIVSSEAGRRLTNNSRSSSEETSNQVMVAIFPKMQTDSDIADYTQRIAQKWEVGKRDTAARRRAFRFHSGSENVYPGYGSGRSATGLTAFEITGIPDQATVQD